MGVICPGDTQDLSEVLEVSLALCAHPTFLPSSPPLLPSAWQMKEFSGAFDTI